MYRQMRSKSKQGIDMVQKFIINRDPKTWESVYHQRQTFPCDRHNPSWSLEGTPKTVVNK